MPNVNLLPVISTASEAAYFILSNDGVVRRYKLDNLVNQVEQRMPGSYRTDQDLFTNTDVMFQSVSLWDQAGLLSSIEHRHGFQSSAYGSDGGAIDQADFLGSIRFGGFDGTNKTLVDTGISSAGVSVVATEGWSSDGPVTTKSGTGMSFFIQPVNTRLSESSRATFLNAITTSSSSAYPSITVLRLGSVLPYMSAPNYASTSSDGTTTFTSAGRTDMIFSAARVYHAGVPIEDTNPINSTVRATNEYTFVSSRRSNYTAAQQPIKQGDSLGVFNFKGYASTSTPSGVLSAVIRAHATSNFDTATPGSGLHFRTLSSSTGVLETNLDLQSEGNSYNSAYHRFADATGNGNTVVIQSGTVVFSNQTVQSTAYQGFTSVPTSSTSTGITGQMAYDANYFYICVYTNQWKRIAATDF